MVGKSKITRSKSSNNATNKSNEQTNKKCNSNSQFQNSSLKKRGVYVEKRITGLSIANQDRIDAKPVKKAPPRPPPHQKEFLTSVLSILSKSTTGTQYPEKKQASIMKDEQKLTKGKRKNKYKSRVLNNVDLQKQFIMPPRKDFPQTPSSFSQSLYEEDVIFKMDMKSASTLKNNIITEPTSLVETNKASVRLYNAIIDLIETSLDDEEATNQLENLVINESVAKLLAIGEEKDSTQDLRSFKDEFSIRNEDNEITPISSKLKSVRFKKNIHSKSFAYPKMKKILPKSKSDEVKKPSNRTKKKDFLKMLKEDLRMDRQFNFEEPQNLYQALKVIANNKRQSQIENKLMNTAECMESRNLLRKNRKAKELMNRRKYSIQKIRYNRIPNTDGSYNSIEIHDIDYKKSKRFDHQKNGFIKYHSSEEDVLNNETILYYPESTDLLKT